MGREHPDSTNDLCIGLSDIAVILVSLSASRASEFFNALSRNYTPTLCQICVCDNICYRIYAFLGQIYERY
jgi:hypothetical protein